MKRTRSKSSPPRLTRDAERLAALATGMAASGSRLEDHFWETRLAEQLTRLLDHGSDAALETALDALYSAEPPAYDALIDAAETHAESLTTPDCDILLIAAPVLAWSKYSIYSGPLRPDLLEALASQFAQCIAAPGARLALLPHLYSIEQLPQHFSKTRELARELGRHAENGASLPAAKRALPETAPLLADTRYVLGALAVPHAAPLFIWQEASTEKSREPQGRPHALERWRAATGTLFASLLTGCSIEVLLPDAYHVSCRESDRAVRPFGIHAAVAFLETALQLEGQALRAVIAPFGEERAEEYRIAFTEATRNDVLHGVVWPLYGREEGPESDGPRDQIETLLGELGIRDIVALDQLFPPEFCEDCGAPLFADAAGELVHPELPEDAEQTRAHLH